MLTTLNSTKNNNIHYTPSSACKSWSGTKLTFGVVTIVSLILGCSDIFQGQICTQDGQLNKSVKQIEINCYQSDLNPNTGFPSLEMDLDENTTPLQSNTVYQVKVHGGWPTLNSLFHVAVPLIVFVILLTARHKGNTTKTRTWLIIAVFYAMATIMDIITVNSWEKYCDLEDPDTTSTNVLSALHPSLSGGNSHALKVSSCSLSSPIALTILQGMACVCALIEMAILKLGSDIEDDMELLVDRNDSDDNTGNFKRI